MNNIARFWRRGLWTLISLSFVLVVCASILYLYLESQLPNVDSLKSVQMQVPLRIYTKDGLLMQEYGEERRIPVTFDEIPPTLVNALLATEDQRFFDHSGVDVMGLGRAAVHMLQTGTKGQGGSTITMQVARNFFLSRKKTFLRKFNEILLAMKIDRELSKEKILELYLNKVNMGNRAYGVAAAAKTYYGKTLKELTLAEMAMIAGLPQAPSTQNPIANPVAAKKRRDHVLERLLEEKFITKAQYDEAINTSVATEYHGANIEVSAPYVAEMIRQSLYEHFGKDTYTKGYKVYTTIDSTRQKAANAAVQSTLLAYDKRHGYRGAAATLAPEKLESQEARHALFASHPRINDLQPVIVMAVADKSASVITRRNETLTLNWEGISWARPALRRGWVGRAPQKATEVLHRGDLVYIRPVNGQWILSQLPNAEAALVALNPNNGAIEALVGGFSFEKSKFNRVTQSGRQPGSSIKPFIYAAALNKGYTLATLVNDAPIVVDDSSQAGLWRPHNDNEKFNGPTRLKEALVRSRNLVSIRILDDIGISYAINFISRFGFNKASLPRGLSLVLGTLSVSPMDLTAAYAVFANGGYRIEPYLIERITDSDGAVLLQAKPAVVCTDCSESQRDASTAAPRVIPEDIAFLMNTALQDVIRHGTGHGAAVLNRTDIAGKTGTTNDQVDAWFAGFNADLVVTAWVGYDNPQSLNEYAAGVALPLWVEFMKVALKNTPVHSMAQPQDIVTASIDPVTGLLAKPGQRNAITEYFQKDALPESSGMPSNYGAQEEVDVQESLF
ncbi:penicillin-binding protein 1A [Legionella geestiana]|uniref:penicillin-binding protein 1A n=1 Tax=Legionella geestiana TaxID=45065 RepID=UPI001091A0B0|nr:penicillin-binding protein 1A [Legionella geestiana]QDQ39128.1 penicillin-binding protein 1A [Legionella geestiana]